MTLVEMTHENLPGVTKTTGLLAYRYSWFPLGWVSADDPEWTGSGDDVLVPLSVEGDLFVRGGDVQIGSGQSVVTLTAADGSLTLPALTLGGVEVTGESGAPDILTVAGAIRTFHDFTFILAGHMTTDGAAPAQAAAASGAPRLLLARGESCQWSREVPAGWAAVGLNILFTKEVSGSGNVHFQFDHQVIDFLTGESLSGATTVTDLAPISVPTTVAGSKYYITGMAAIATPPQPFGIPPLIRSSLLRVDDGTDTFGAGARDIGIVAISVSRTDP